MVELETLFDDDKLSHVYIIETNDFDMLERDLKKLLKKLLCLNNECDDCQICSSINKEHSTYYSVVEKETSVITKSQIQNLIKTCETIPYLTANNVYIIRGAEKITKEASNSMLKFIEEPHNNCYGFLLVNDKESLLPTIKSRAQVIKKIYDVKFDDEISEIIKEYINTIKQGIQKALEFNLILKKKFSTKDELIVLFEEMAKIFKDNQVILKIIYEILSNLNYNVNIDMQLDKFVIEMSGING